MNHIKNLLSRRSPGFTLIEMAVIAPIVILLIGTFIALIVNLTGEVMSTRGANILTYNVQDALNRIEQDVKLSTTFLSVNNIDISTTKQGYGGTTTTGSTTNFTNVDKTSSSGSTASIILNVLVTDGNPLSTSASLVYLKDQPNPCTSSAEYSKNRPMTANVVYFIDSSNTLWRRVIMPANYKTASVYCGNAPWQIPSCISGYSAGSLPFCKTNDEKLVEGVAPSDFAFQYYPSASSTTPSTSATNTSLSDDARGTALLSTPTLNVSITARQTSAGRDITRSASLRATRLDSNASSIAKDVPVTSAPSTPTPSGAVSNGHILTVTWPQVNGASSYEASYRINGGAWSATTANISNTTRSYVVSAANHTDTVDVQVRATNSFGSSSYTTSTTIIPLWAPLMMAGGYTDYGGGYSTAAYTRTKAGYVILKGLIKKTAAVTVGETIATLPADYRPGGGALIFGTSTNSNTWGRVDVWPNGVITNSGGSNAWFSLESIHFISSASGYTSSAPALQNGWVNYAPASWAPASYIQDSSGRVNIQGLIASGSMSDGTPIFNLPAALAPPGYLHIAAHATGTGFSFIGINASTPAVLAKGAGTNGYYSITSSYLPATAATWTSLTLQNGWAWYGGIFSSPQYTKTNDGVVHLKGLITGGTNTYDWALATLPAGFRPKERILTTTANTGAYSRFDILANGEIHFMGTSNVWYSLDGISFVAEQ